MAASDHLSRVQFTGADVAKHVPGSGMGKKHYRDQPFTLVDRYPVDRVMSAVKSGAEMGGKYVDLEKHVRAGTALPIVVSDAARAPEAILHDGWHRVSIAKAAGITHLPAYVRDLDAPYENRGR